MVRYNSQTPRFVCNLFLLLLANTSAQLIECGNLNKYVIIRNQRTGLAVDAKHGTYLTVEELSQSDAQQWLLHPSARIGSFNIINKRSGQALDIDTTTRNEGGFNATLKIRDDSVYQQWFIHSNGTISSGALSDYVVDIIGVDIPAGSLVMVYSLEDTSEDHRKLSLEYI